MKLEKFSLYLFAAVALTGIFIHQFFTPYNEFTDGLSLYNPIYMKLNHGKLVYPIYGYYDNMPVHPPTYYYIVAFFMQLGFNLFYAFNLPVFLIRVVFVIILLRSAFKTPVKAAGILAVVLPLISEPLSVRPDIFLSLVWVTGLTALQAAAIDQWKKTNLIIGSSLLAFSSTLHFFGSFAFLGSLVYAYKIYTDKTEHNRWKKIKACLLPAILIIGVYLLFYVLPNFIDIYHQIANSRLYESSSITVHYHNYGLFFWNNPVLLFILKMPACIWAILFFAGCLRMLSFAVAALPVTLFVLFFSPGKSGGYFTPEFLLFYWGIFAVLATWFAQNKLHTAKGLSILLVTLFLIQPLVLNKRSGILHALITTSKQFNIIDVEREIIRACSKNIVGNNATIASRMDLWYISGAAKWHNLSPDLLWGDSTYDHQLHRYFESFDAIVDHAHMSNNSQRNDLETISSWYVEDTLKLKAFYLSDNLSGAKDNSNVISLLFYSPNKVSKIKGFTNVGDKHLIYYEQDSTNYDYYFVTTVVKSGDSSNAVAECFTLCNRFTLPDKNGEKYQLGNQVKEELLWGIVAKQQYQNSRFFLQTHSKIRDVVPLKSHLANRAELLKALNADPKILFYKTYQDVVVNNPQYMDN